METKEYLLIITIAILGLTAIAYISDRIRFKKRIERRRKDRATDTQYMIIVYIGVLTIVLYYILNEAQKRGFIA